MDLSFKPSLEYFTIARTLTRQVEGILEKDENFNPKCKPGLCIAIDVVYVRHDTLVILQLAKHNVTIILGYYSPIFRSKICKVLNYKDQECPIWKISTLVRI